jgi:hypothetical protein
VRLSVLADDNTQICMFPTHISNCSFEWGEEFTRADATAPRSPSSLRRLYCVISALSCRLSALYCAAVSIARLTACRKTLRHVRPRGMTELSV